MNRIHLKSIITGLFFSLFLASCTTDVAITGKIKNATSDHKLYLIQPEQLNEVAASFFGKVIDSATIAEDGSFSFEQFSGNSASGLFEIVLQAPGKAPNYLISEDPKTSNYMPVIFQQKSIKIAANFDEFQQSFSIENPSEENKALLQLRDLKNNAYQKYLANKTWQVEDGSQLLEKEEAILNYQKSLMNFADNSEHFLPAMQALRWVSPEHDFERIPEFLVRQCQKWQEKNIDNSWLNELCEMSSRKNLPVLIGDTFPEVMLPSITKDSLSIIKNLGSKLTIIDLWASWCVPCRKENRNVLVPLYEEYKNEGLEIIAYALESNEKTWKMAAESDGANAWIQLSELQGDDTDFLKKIRIRTIPANFILDKNGIVIAKNIHGEALIDLVKSEIEKE